MEIKQIYEVVNNAQKDVLGEKAITLNEDLSNIVDVGNEVFNANSFDAFTKKLVDHIGRVVFVVRKYVGRAPSVVMDAWEYGSVLEKIRAEMPEAVENESWELEDGESYDPNIFHAPQVSAKFYNKYTTFEVDISVTEEQLKSAFSGVQQLNSFLSMLYNEVDKSLQVKTDLLVMRTINNFIAETIHDDYGTDALASKSGVKAINLLYLYNQRYNQSLTKDKAIEDKDFIRFASYIIKLYLARIQNMSTLFNIGKRARFTPKDALHLVMLADFKSSADVFLQSETFHNELSALPNAEEVAYWQGTGTDFTFANVSKISVKTSEGNEVTLDGVLAFAFDRDALGVSNWKRKVTSNYNSKAEFTNLFYKQKAGYFNDFNENGIVFFIQ